MALSDLLPPAFKSGPSPDQPPLVLSPASVERRRRVAEAMMKQGMDYSPIQSPWQGVARVTNAIMGGLDERKADDIERAGLASQRDADASMYGGLLNNGGGSAGVPITGALGGAGGGNAPAVNGPQGAAGAANYADGKTAAAGLIKGFEGYRDKPYWDTNAYRTGYGSDTVTNPDGTVVPVRQGMQITRDQADADLTRRIGEFQGGIVKTVGPDAWGKLPPAAQGALTSVAYNYGHLPGEVARAVQTGDPHAIAAAVSGLSANPKRRHQEASAILSGWNPAPQAAPQVASADPDITGSIAPPAGPGASLSPEDMATLTARYGGGTPPAAAGITDAPVAINPPAAGASGPLSPAAAHPLNPGSITDAPVPAGNPLAIPAPLPIPAIGANGLPERTNAGLRNQGIDPLQFMHGYEPTPATGSVPPPGAPPVAPSAPVPMPPVDPRTASAPAAPATPRASVLAALQGPLKDSQVQMMIARGINPANPQAPVSPARQSILAALSGAAPAPPQAAQSPAAAQVTGALAAPATVPASVPPYPGQPAPVADAGGNPAQLAAAIKTMSNPWAPEGSRQMAKTIIDRELQARDPLRRMQMLKLQQDMQGGTPDEIKQRQLAIQKTEQEINAPLIIGDTAVDRKTMLPVYQPGKKGFKEFNGHLYSTDERTGDVADKTPNAPAGYRPATPDERKAYGVADGVPLFFGPDGKPAALGPQTSIVNQGGETEFKKQTAIVQSKMFNTMVEDGIQARSDLGNIANLRDHITKLPGGMLGGVQNIANSWGIKLGENASDLEAANAIISKLIPAQREGMPGAASDRDVSMFRDALVKPSNTPEGNKLIMDTMEALAQQRRKQGQIALMGSTGQISPEETIKQLYALPDPFEAFRKAQGGDAGAGGQGGAPAVAVPAAPAAPAPAAVVATPAPATKSPFPEYPNARQNSSGRWFIPNPNWKEGDPATTKWTEVTH